LGIHKLAPWKPDLVISGINLGANMGEDLLYSGTVGAALEAKGLDFPSIAISAAAFHQPGSENHMEPNYKTAALVVLDLIKNYDLGSIDPSLVLNVNTPNIDYSDELEYRITSVGSWGPRNPPGVRVESDGRTSYWTTHRENYEEDNTDCDIRALIDKKVSISPIRPFFSIAGSDYQNFRLNKK
jgi:5'-nucleotidase